MTKIELVELVNGEWEKWQAALAQVDEGQMERPGVEGEWSVKDIIAHISWHEKEMIGIMAARALVASELWARPLDERNGIIYEQNRERPLAEVLTEAEQTHRQMVTLLEGLSEEEVNDSSGFRDMPAEWLPWVLIGENSYQHYPDNAAAVEVWLNSQGR